MQAKLLFQGTRYNVIEIGKWQVIDHPGAVVILPILDNHSIILIRNFRIAVGEELWELPAGTLEPDEPPLETAKRELQEETGYQAGRIEQLSRFYASPGICNEVMYSYVAEDLKNVGQQLQENEQIQVEVVPWKKAIDMLRDGIIRDAKSITTLLYYQTFRR